jgi:hypothetical protein
VHRGVLDDDADDGYGAEDVELSEAAATGVCLGLGQAILCILL